MKLLLWSVAIAGCGMNTADGTVLGTPDDLKVAPGTYDGYRLVRPCAASPSLTAGLEGIGTQAPTDEHAIASLGGELLATFSDLQSVWGGGGFGLACASGVGTDLFIDDWRDVDGVIVRAGRWLEERDLGIKVTISVVSIPVAE